MTNIVLKRTDKTVNAKLTLAHLLNLLQGTLTKDGTVFIITTNHIEHLDPAFYREGRFDLTIKMQNADHYQCNEIYYNFHKRYIHDDLLSLLPENTFTPAKFIFYLVKNIWDENINDEDIITEFVQILSNESKTN